MSESSKPDPQADPRRAGADEWSAESVPSQSEAPEFAPPAEEAEAEPKKKRYYSPNEVMKKKGCIGCGGMALAAVIGPLVLAALLAIL